MAATDAKPIPEKNQAYRVYFPIFDNDGDLVPGAASLDSEVSIDGGNFADCTNEATEIQSTGMYFIDLTAAEMNGSAIIVIIKTTTTDAKTTPIVLYPREAGDILVRLEDCSANAINAAAIAASAIESGKFAAGAINAAAIATDAITNAKIAADAIGASEIATGAIDADAIAANAITAAKIATDAITAAKIAADAIGASEIADGAITADKLAANAITAAKIASDAITAAKIATDAITNAKIAADAIGASEIANDAITAAKIATDAIDGDALAATALAEIKTQMTDALTVDTHAAPGKEAPASTQSYGKMLAYLYKQWRNKSTQDGSLTKLFNDDATTVDQQFTTSEAGGTVTIEEVVIGA